MFDYCVYIGRFQPFHNGHYDVLKHALTTSKQVIVAIGSAFKYPDLKNPFSTSERIEMIQNSLTSDEQVRVTYIGIPDTPYNDLVWRDEIVTEVCRSMPQGSTVALIGYDKDESSAYLKIFPEWEFVDFKMTNNLNATNIRNGFFHTNSQIDPKTIPASTLSFLEDYRNSDEFQRLTNEFSHINDYRLQWSNAPFPPVFVTVDAVVIQDGYILLVERGNHPGKGSYALPGGFLDQSETLIEACVREVYEETLMDIPKSILYEAVTKTQVFDHPNRSNRGRTITHAFLFNLDGNMEKLPKVKGNDDAASASWVPLSKVKAMRCKFFEDHYHMIDALVEL